MSELTEFNNTLRFLVEATTQAMKLFNELADVIIAHREELLITGCGQWPDKFTLLNRYVRTDYEPPFIINV